MKLTARGIVFTLPPLHQFGRTGFASIFRIQLDHAAPLPPPVAAGGCAGRPLRPRSDDAVDDWGLVFSGHRRKSGRRGQGSQGAERG